MGTKLFVTALALLGAGLLLRRWWFRPSEWFAFYAAAVCFIVALLWGVYLPLRAVRLFFGHLYQAARDSQSPDVSLAKVDIVASEAEPPDDA